MPHEEERNVTWVNDFEKPLFCVKRKYAEEYHTGSHSYVMPKMYKIGNAKSVCKKQNEYLAWHQNEDGSPYSFSEWKDKNTWYSSRLTEEQVVETYNSYLKEHAKGPWVVAIVQFTSSEYEE